MTAPMAPFEIREYPVPDPEPGGMIVRIRQAGICGSDLHSWHGHQGPQGTISANGRLMGHEGSGVIARLGAGVTTDALGQPLKEGDRVIHSAVQPCGHCYYCQRGEPNWCPSYPPGREAGVPPYFVATFADYYYVTPQQPVYKVPDGVPDNSLSFVNCALGTVTEGLTRADAGPGDTVVIFGAGGLGLNATGIARHRGVDQVVILDRQPKRLELAKAFGAGVTLNIDEFNTPEARLERIRELTGGRGASIVMDLVGNPTILEEGVPMLASGGTYIQIGAVGAGKTSTIAPGMLMRGKTIMGSLMYKPQRIPMLLDILDRHRDRFPFDKIVSNQFPLDKVNEAFHDADWQSRSTDVTRAILVP
jgi:threonine dehydrogenase-like Zn-dependent dehydrogenase